MNSFKWINKFVVGYSGVVVVYVVLVCVCMIECLCVSALYCCVFMYSCIMSLSMEFFYLRLLHTGKKLLNINGMFITSI